MLLSNRILSFFSSQSVLKGLQSYKGSPAQKHLHSYIRNQQQFTQLKKTIDYETITKSSKGRVFIRQFLFQQKVEQNYIAPINSYLLPQGKWTRQELKATSQRESVTKTQQQNQEIINSCAPDLQLVFKRYYKRLGKPTYRFILSEEIGKVSRMSQAEFAEFVQTLGGDLDQILNHIKTD